METLAQILNSPALEPLDRQFAKFIERLSGEPEIALAAALVSFQRNRGHSCIHLPTVTKEHFVFDAEGERAAIALPKLAPWLKTLRASRVVGKPGEFKPLILDAGDRLYLHRYWNYEDELARSIRARVNEPVTDVDWKMIPALLGKLFPNASRETDWQKVAAFAALRRKFCVISGGPGTGKTHTAALILALLIEQAGGRKLRIALTAPTGKAAARLQDSIKARQATLACSDATKAQLPESASTIHRLLGSIPGSAYFQHDAKNPLALDVVVVDEASMVDLALMAKLFAAVPLSTRLILLGDKDQLASVEAGAVLGDICNAGEAHELSKKFAAEFAVAADASPLILNSGKSEPTHVGGYDAIGNKELNDCIVELRKNRRFGEDGGIFVLSRAVNRGDTAGARDALARKLDGISHAPLPSRSQLKQALEPLVREFFAPCFESIEPETVLKRLDAFRILAAVRKGPFGVEALNRLVEEILRADGKIAGDSPWYAGRPVMITRNDYGLKLFNGDIGVALPDAEGTLRVWFRGAENSLRSFLPLQLPDHETVFAMTIHKSQGSEFPRVLIVLPDKESPVLTRELIYTGATRASEHAELWMRDDVFSAAIARRIGRASGLRDALWETH